MALPEEELQEAEAPQLLQALTDGRDVLHAWLLTNAAPMLPQLLSRGNQMKTESDNNSNE